MLARILVVHTDLEVRRTLARRLEYRGYLVQRASSVEEANAYLLQERIDSIAVAVGERTGMEIVAQDLQIPLVVIREEESRAARDEADGSRTLVLEALIDRIESSLRS